MPEERGIVQQRNGFIGRQLGQYEIQAELGRGGMSHVYRAYQPRLHRHVAIKVIAMDITTQPNFRQRFEQEAQAIAQLSHPNIVAVYDFGEDEDVVYLVMQYVAGGTLKQRLGRLLPVSEAVAYMIQMARALHHAHLHGVIHRDVKPANMLVDADDPRHLLLSDFGIAKLVGHTDITGTGITIGTPEYMAPEQAENRPVDARTDVYALGTVLYEALAGQPPFTGASPVTVLYQQVHSLPAYIRGYNPEVPRELAQIVATALAKRPEDRFPSAEAFARALEPFARLRGGRGVFAPLPAVPAILPAAATTDSASTPAALSTSPVQPAPTSSDPRLRTSQSAPLPSVPNTQQPGTNSHPPMLDPAPAPVLPPAWRSPAAGPQTLSPEERLAQARRSREQRGLGSPPKVDIPQRDMVTQFVLGLALVSLLIVFGLSWMLLSATQSSQPQSADNQARVSTALSHPTATQPHTVATTPSSTTTASPTMTATSTPTSMVASSVITNLYITTSLVLTCNPASGLSQVPSGQQIYYFICLNAQSNQNGKAQVRILKNGQVVNSSTNLPAASSWRVAYFFFQDPLPAGTYEVVAYWNGQAAQTTTFTVQ